MTKVPGKASKKPKPSRNQDSSSRHDGKNHIKNGKPTGKGQRNLKNRRQSLGRKSPHKRNKKENLKGVSKKDHPIGSKKKNVIRQRNAKPSSEQKKELSKSLKEEGLKKSDSPKAIKQKATPGHIKNRRLSPEESSKAIRIKNLPRKVESLSSELKLFISSIAGPVKFIIFKKITCPGNAFVHAICVFSSSKSTRKAVAKLNGKDFVSHHILVQNFKESVSDTLHISSNCVYVRNIPTSYTEETLWAFFQHCGTIEMIHLYRENKTAYEGIINFKEEEAVEKALDCDVTESKMDIVHIQWDKCLVFANLGMKLSLQDLRNFLEGYQIAYMCFGPKRKHETKKAYVFFSDRKSFKKASKLNGQVLVDLPVSVEPGSLDSTENKYSVIVAKIPKGTDVTKLHDLFKQFGTVTKIIWPFRKTLARISFKSEEELQESLKVSELLMDGVKLYVCKTVYEAEKMLPGV